MEALILHWSGSG